MRYFVIKEIDCDDPIPFAVVEHQRMVNGHHLVIRGGWFEKEEEARAAAHRLNHPEYD